MRKMGIVLTAAMMLFWGSAAFAEGTKTTLGVKTWLSSWEDSGSAGAVLYYAELMIGPAVDVEFENKMFLKGSFLFAVSDYEDSYFSAPSNGMLKISDRKDLDLMAGYMFTPQFGAFAGYKSITAEFIDEWPIGTVVDTMDVKINGPGVGVLGSFPVNKTVTLYGSLGWMFLDIEYAWAGGSASDDIDGPSVEIGAAFAVSPHSVINVGYKHDKFSGTVDSNGSSFDHAFLGLTAGFKYMF